MVAAPFRRHPVGIALALAVLAAAAAFGAAWATTPSVRGLDGTVALRTGTTTAATGDVAPIMREAVVAIEDERFYQHRGIDVLGVLRAVPYDVTHLSLAQGASTLTEQLAKLLYLGGNDHSPWRKLEDVALAVKLEDRYTKEQILTAYLRTAYFDGASDGVAAASRRFFGIPPSRLDLAQASLLAGLVQAPSAYDPLVHPAAARARQTNVLRALVRNGYATNAEARHALARPLHVDATTLPPVVGVSLAPGPAFVWWQLAAGTAAILAGTALLLIRRRFQPELRGGPLLLRLTALTALAAGAAVVVRSFRVI
ncbi:MAG TPA: biosynthetic peptidoglycan transglycosylase [Gaiellaceae bacterium]|nr:biosynthetic peptidoglycan transglycosylase [Gaiellaceae bacterium]